MAQYDGAIRIVTKITTKDAEESLASLEWQIKKSAKYMDELRSKMDTLKEQKFYTDDYKNLQSDLKEATKTLSKLIETQEEWESLGITSGDAWDSLNERIAQASDNVDSIKEKIQQLEEAGKDFVLGQDTAEYKSMEQQLAYEEEAIIKAGEHYKRLKEEASGVAEEQRLAQIKENATVSDQNIIALLERRKQLTQEIADMESAGIGVGYKEYDSAISELSQINGKVKEYKENILEAKESTSEVPERFSKIREAAQKSFSSIKSGLSSVLNSSKKAFSSLASAAGRAFSSIGSGAKRSGGLLSTFASRLKGLALSLLIFNWISKGFNAMISGMKTGFANFAGYSSSFANAIQSMKNAMSTLGNQAAAAFAPFVQAVIPMLVSLINTLTRATAAVAQFIAAITGKSTYKKATAAAEGYAGALNKTAGAAKNLSKQLSSLDKLNNLTSQDSSGGGGGGGGGSGAGYGDMFEDADISSKIKDFADLIKKSWEEADFTEVGAIIGRKIKEGLDRIPWADIKATAGKVGKSLATLINGLVSVEGLGNSIGKTLAEVINTGFSFLNKFVHNLDWASVGKFIADTVNGFFTSIDWDLIYDTFVTGAKGLGDAINSFVDNVDWDAISDAIANFVNTVVDTIYTFITTVDWKNLGKTLGTTISNAWKKINWGKAGKTIGEAFKAFFDFVGTAIASVDWKSVGKSVKNFLVGIDWNGVAESFFRAIGASLGGLGAFLIGLIEDGWNETVNWWKDTAFEDGKFTIGGLLDGIQEKMNQIGTWILDHVSTPIIEEIEKALGIDGGISEEFKKRGKAIIDGLTRGADENMPFLMKKLDEIKKDMKKKFEFIEKNFIPCGKAIITGLKGGILEKWPGFIGFWTGKKDDMVKKFENIKDKFITKGKAVVSGIQSGISTNWSKFSEWWGKKKDGVVDKFSNIKSKMESVGKNIVNGIISGIQAIWSKLTGLVDKIKGMFDIKPKISASVSTIASGGASSVLPRAAMPALASVPIPALATGAVIPPNKEFLAVLGDQKSGTNVEAPLSTIEQAVTNAMQKNNGFGSGGEITIKIPVEVDGRVLFELMKKFDLDEYRRTGRPSFQF